MKLLKGVIAELTLQIYLSVMLHATHFASSNSTSCFWLFINDYKTDFYRFAADS